MPIFSLPVKDGLNSTHGKSLGMVMNLDLPSGHLLHSYWKWQFIVSFPINSMVIFHSFLYVTRGYHVLNPLVIRSFGCFLPAKKVGFSAKKLGKKITMDSSADVLDNLRILQKFCNLLLVAFGFVWKVVCPQKPNGFADHYPY